MKEKKKVVSVCLEPTIIEQIKRYAETDNRSISQYLSLIVSDYFKQLEKKGKKK